MFFIKDPLHLPPSRGPYNFQLLSFLQKKAPPINPTNCNNENMFTYLTTSDISGSILDPLIDLVQNDEVQGRLFEASRQFFTSSNITVTKRNFEFCFFKYFILKWYFQVNLLPALILGALLLFGLPLLFAGHGGSDTGTNYQVARYFWTFFWICLWLCFWICLWHGSGSTG